MVFVLPEIVPGKNSNICKTLERIKFFALLPETLFIAQGTYRLINIQTKIIKQIKSSWYS